MSDSSDPLETLLQRPTSNPEWLAMIAYGLLIFLYLNQDTSLLTLSSVLGFMLMISSKYLKTSESTNDTAKIVQTWGYVFLVLGLGFDEWRDALATLAYGMVIIDIPGAVALVNFVLALNVGDSHGWGKSLALLALIIYNS